MHKIDIKLANTIYWDPNERDKVYMESIYIAIRPFPFDTRKVVLRFASGPALDLSILDMDRIAIEYLKLRGLKLPKRVCQLINAEPPQCDFVVPDSVYDGSLEKKESLTAKPTQRVKRKRSSNEAARRPTRGK